MASLEMKQHAKLIGSVSGRDISLLYIESYRDAPLFSMDGEAPSTLVWKQISQKSIQ